MKNIFLLILFVFSACSTGDGPVSSESVINGTWDYSVTVQGATNTGTIQFNAQNGSVSGSAYLQGFSQSTFTGSYTSTSINYICYSNESFGLCRWEFVGAYSANSMSGSSDCFADVSNQYIGTATWAAQK